MRNYKNLLFFYNETSRRPMPADQVFSQIKLIDLLDGPLSLPRRLSLRLQMRCPLFQAFPASHIWRAKRFHVPGPQRLMRLATDAATMHVPRFVFAYRAAAAVAGEAQRLLSPCLLRVGLVTPSVSASEDVLYAFVCLELAGLSRPVCGQGTPVHIL